MSENWNLAARAGRWSATHRKTAIGGWLAFVIALVVIGGAVGTKAADPNEGGPGEAGRAEKTLNGAFAKSADETVLVQSKSLTAGDQRFRAAVRDTVNTVSAQPLVRKVRSPYGTGDISRDRHSALVSFDIEGKTSQTEDRVGAVLSAVQKVDKRQGGDIRVEEFGEASSGKALSDRFADDFTKAETLSLPLTLAILVVAFGALVAAGIPLLLAATAVAATIGLIGPISHAIPVEDSIGSVVLLIGLAVGVDYSMFYLRREREERARGREERAALAVAAATSGRAVLVSGLTVAIAMAGMFLGGSRIWTAFAIGTILVVAIAVVGSLTVLPATLAWLGDRVEKGRVPLIGRRKRSAGESRAWGWVIDRVLRRPLVSALVAAGALLALAAPVLGMKTALPGPDTYPRDLAVMKTYDRIQTAFPGNPIPAVVVVRADDVRSPEVRGAITDMRRQAVASGSFAEPATIKVAPSGTVASVDLPIAGRGTDQRSNAALDRLRDQIIPSTLGKVDGVKADVTGETAGTADFNALMKSRIFWVFAFVLGLAFLLLLVTFRSIVIPMKAIVLNLLSVGAAYGLLKLVFQDGHGESLLGFQSTGAIASWLPLFLFVVLFGLSMDYHVFILSRIRELVDNGMSTDQAVSHGIKTTAGVVTSAAAIMVAVFGVFATLSTVEFKQMGVGLAAAVLIDATVIRGVLLPATMKLLGDWNWYLPQSLDWLPRISRERPRTAEAETARA
jgi:RND superfamily putative drug exporter